MCNFSKRIYLFPSPYLLILYPRVQFRFGAVNPVKNKNLHNNQISGDKTRKRFVQFRKLHKLGTALIIYMSTKTFCRKQKKNNKQHYNYLVGLLFDTKSLRLTAGKLQIAASCAHYVNTRKYFTADNRKPLIDLQQTVYSATSLNRNAQREWSVWRSVKINC